MERFSLGAFQITGKSATTDKLLYRVCQSSLIRKTAFFLLEVVWNFHPLRRRCKKKVASGKVDKGNRSLWLKGDYDRRIEDAPQILGAFPMRRMFGLRVQTFHVWLPSFCRFAAHKAFSSNLLAVAMLVNLANFSATPAQNISAVGKRQAAGKKPLLVAHRGASGYAPEHTLLAYGMAIEQGADFVEQDLQITKDGVLVCLHDAELSRTTNVREVFPERATMRDTTGQGTPKQGWYVVDFTLEEIKKLNAGVWFYKLNPFADTKKFSLASMGRSPSELEDRIPTLQETIKFVNNRAGLYIEMKDSEFYKAMGFDMAEKLSAVLKANGYANAKKSQRIFIQSFSKENLLRIRQIAPQYPRVQLLPMEDARRNETAKVTPELAKEIAEYAQGVGPAKAMIKSAKDVETFHAAGLVVHLYTFRGQTTAVLRKPLDEKLADGLTVRENIIAEIQRYLAFGVDGGFTDYPALWKEAYRLYRPH